MSFGQLRTEIQRTLKSAASFHKVDLHVHSKNSYDFAKKDEPPSQADIDCQPISFVDAALKKGIQMISITDHNRCGYAFQVRHAAEEYQKTGQDKYEYNSLKVLPGCEISVDYNGRNIHVLAIFPEETSEHEIENIFDGTGIDPNPSGRTKDSKVTLIKLRALLEKIRRKNGICIACHINETNGIREEIKKLNEVHILKLEKKQRELKDQGKTIEAEALEREIGKAKENAEGQFRQEVFIDSLFDAVEIKKPEERRHFEKIKIEAKKYTRACVINSDAHYLNQIGLKTNITRIKMDEPGYNGLKRAFQDPTTRIRFEEELSQVRIKRIIGLRIDKGFLDGQVIGFTENLNCLIGGRGTGKTSVIEIIRFLLEENIPTLRKDDIDSLMLKVFEGSVATMIFQDDNGNEYVLQRSLGPKQV
jgi:PHP family Zn ribbon phosphoesterase